jgi:hypothetical protein
MIEAETFVCSREGDPRGWCTVFIIVFIIVFFRGKNVFQGRVKGPITFHLGCVVGKKRLSLLSLQQ